MHRQVQEWIITVEVMKLERRQALERARPEHGERPRPTGAPQPRQPRRSMRPQPPA